MSRFLGVNEKDCPASIQGGFVRGVEFVKVSAPTTKDKGRFVIHEVNGGTFFKAPAQPTKATGDNKDEEGLVGLI